MKPLLSIGIIFKNEIRCLERCLKSLQPLREAVPCEVVMADTGSNDGSREVAERYADVLFDFPWINDFSAARNAVMDRCNGVWYLSVDADEWLDSDIRELAAFLTTDHSSDWASLHIYNYTSPELDHGGSYSDFIAMRMMRMSTGSRFEGVVHERWEPKDGSLITHLLSQTVLHHDGYLKTDYGQAHKKALRNMELLKIKLAQNPDDLATLLQCAENAAGEETLRYVRQALESGGPEKAEWKRMGAPLLRQAVRAASETNSSELKDWIDRAEREFPDSIFVRVDVACYAFSYYLSQRDYDACIRAGEGYLRAVEDYQAERFDRGELQYSILNLAGGPWVRKLKIYLADVYQRAGQTERAYATLASLDGHDLDGEQTRDFVRALRYVHAHSDTDNESLLLRFWEQIRQPGPVEGREKERQMAFLQAAAGAFSQGYRTDEKQGEDFRRPAYTLFLPLCGKCEPGTAAALLETEDTARLESLLTAVEDWALLPPEALDHALRRGVQFPLPEKPLNVETMDLLSARLSACGDCTALLPTDVGDARTLCWARGLVFAAIRSCNWEDDSRGMELAHRFAETERQFLPLCYAPEALTEEKLFLLPPMHRFGWYCVRAFAALETGDTAGYVRLLRAGLETAPEMKPMVEFLTKKTPELQLPPPSSELLAMAEQVRTMLAAYDPNDPAVAALKQSPVYQRVAYLIEGGGA